MKKQILYPTLIPRLFAMALDLTVLGLFSVTIMSIITKIIFTLVFREFLNEQNIGWATFNFDMQIFHTKEFAEYLYNQHKGLTYLICLISLNVINIILAGIYFITFWVKKGATPGKIIMRMKIVDADTLQHPTKKQFIKRFMSYVTAFIGIWSVIFTKKRQAMHDKIAKTIVIKT